jgi:toxin ParE1/3/4
VTLPVEFAGVAEADLESIADYIGQDNPKRAISFIRELVARCKRIAIQPRAFPLREEFGSGIRAAVHGSYLILYAERNDRLVIERIVHGVRDLDHLDL